MLKKLLASALAVATVASCAYVPTALASAAVVGAKEYVHATAVDYEAYQLENPAESQAKTAVTVYVAGDKSKTLSLKVENTAVDTVTAEAKKAMEAEDKAESEESLVAIKYDYANVVPAGETGRYVMTATKSTLIEYTIFPSELLTVVYVKDESEVDETVGLGVMGWYTEAQLAASKPLADAYSTVLQNKVQIAGYAFASWTYDNAGLLIPTTKPVEPETLQYYYTKVALSTTTSETDATKLKTGSYAKGVASGYYWVPTANLSSAAIYLENRLLADGTGEIEASTGFKYNNIRYIENLKVTEQENGKDVEKSYRHYAATYVAEDDPADDSNKYSYTLTVNITKATDATADAAAVVFDVKKSAKLTTDYKEIYSIVKGSSDPATIEEYLAENVKAAGEAVDDKFKFDKVTGLTVTDTDKTVEITISAVQYAAVPVYHYNDEGIIAEGKAYLSAAERENNKSYGDGTVGDISATETVMAANADALGIPASTTVTKSYTDSAVGKVATFAYAKYADDAVEVTYTLADPVVKATMADFQTATGAFQVEPYFCRENAYVGDKVMLKVALTDAGKAKGLDINKVTVKYDLVGATAGANYHFAPAEGDTRPEGIATDITLAEGTNIAVANVYYNGVQVGTFAPFYTVAVAK